MPPIGRAVVLAVLAAGCQQSSEIGVDAAVVIDATTDGEVAPIDAAAVCAGPGECACFCNDDCPETHACTSLDDTGENVWCLEGPRGTGVAGDLCEGEADCASALCVEDAEGTFRCSDLCEVPEDCPDSLPECLFIGFGVDKLICAP